jgi:predicted lipid-binding transport protein (Tim44 family)
MEKIDLFTLISLIVAVVVILKLRSVLGRRTGDEEARLERYRAERRQQEAAGTATDNVVAIPRREGAPAGPTQEVALADAEERIKDYPGLNAEVRDSLLDVAKLDPAFDPESFLRGARQAYEMIVTAFAEGNRKILKDLLNRDVYDGFVRAMSERESRGEQVDQSFVGINKADIVESEVTPKKEANITVRFVSQLISATRDKAGAILSGDPQKVKDVTDVWTFSRDLSSAKARANPNWRLIATQSPA